MFCPCRQAAWAARDWAGALHWPGGLAWRERVAGQVRHPPVQDRQPHQEVGEYIQLIATRKEMKIYFLNKSVFWKLDSVPF